MNAGRSEPRYAPATHPLETLGLWLLGTLVGVGAVVWLTGELSGRLFSGAWPHTHTSDIGSIVLGYRHHLLDPAQAWPTGARRLLPGPAAFYATMATLVLPAFAASAWLAAHRRDRSGARGANWARGRDLRTLRISAAEPGRLSLGRVDGRLVAAESRQSAIVIGPTQTGKTTGFAIPAILEWQGPVVATSVKTDLLRETLSARAALPRAQTWVYDPTGSTGMPAAGWTPLMECLTWQGAQRTADWLVRAARPAAAGIESADFWYGAAAKILAPILLAAACSGGTMNEVIGWLDMQETALVRLALGANDELDALTAVEAISMWDERTRGSVYATAQTILNAYTDPGVLDSAMTADLRAKHLLDGGHHTAYLCAPAHEQRRLQPLFATLVQEVIAHAYGLAAETGKPLDPPLLLVLDECANIAPLRELATLAATGAGQGIQLVTIFQDMAQINAVYGRDHAPTILSNHRAKVILSGISDPMTLTYIARLLGNEETQHTSTTSGGGGHRSTTNSVVYRDLAPAHILREMQPGHGILVYGHLPPARITLRPWFKERRLRRLTTPHRQRTQAALP